MITTIAAIMPGDGVNAGNGVMIVIEGGTEKGLLHTSPLLLIAQTMMLNSFTPS